MAIELSGEYANARIMAESGSLIEDNCIEQVERLLDHPAFTEEIRVMPDAHVGAGGPVGFTMALPDRVVPNIVGVDVGCGMAATNLGDTLPLDHSTRERRVREAVPMGQEVHAYDDAVHLIDEFPFERANRVFEQFAAQYRERFGREIDPIEFEFSGYDGEYFKSLCRRVLGPQRQGMGHVIRSAGTLGGGNHFVEFAQARESGEYWLVIHSGSRYLGKSVAEYWQRRASEHRKAEAAREAIPEAYTEFLRFDPETVSNEDLFAWLTGGKGQSHMDKASIRESFDGEAVDAVFQALAGPREALTNHDSDLDWLAGREADGYYVDMLFAQQYARFNRELMSEAVYRTLGIEADSGSADRFQSVHNYIDFRDLTIRKGATPAREGERLVVPFNMAEGSVIARGKGNEAYNHSAPHGAGRVMSRRDAHERLSLAAFDAAMEDVYSESVVESTLDEAPMAYKAREDILAALEPTAEVVDRLDPVHNLKAV